MGCACGKSGRETPLLNRRSSDGLESAQAPPIVYDVLRSPGQPLNRQTRAVFEPRFGRDFSQVRVHSDARASESARAVNARAYTVGNNLVFGAREYMPRTIEGRRLIAHELAHAVQQSSTNYVPGAPLQVSRTDSTAEREAEHTESHIAAAPSAPGSSLGRPEVQRSPLPGDPTHVGFLESFFPEAAPGEPGKDKGGPGDPGVKYAGALMPPCPAVGTSDSRDDLAASQCVGEDPGQPANCKFLPQQTEMLRAAQRKAGEIVRRAQTKVAGRGGRALAADVARRLFAENVPSGDAAVEVLGRVAGLLTGGDIWFAGQTCGTEICREKPVPVYVLGKGTLPIHVCPLAFHEPPTLYLRVLHEAVHWAGIDADPATKELYCDEGIDCNTACGGSDVADSWMHYLDCLGAAPRVRGDSKSGGVAGRDLDDKR